MTKREADFLERVIREMRERDYWAFVGWLGAGIPEPLWNYMRPFRSNESNTAGCGEWVQ